ncbi:MAG: ATP-binding cassette domain-containing protein [Pseudomonadota bacterium]
MLEVHALSCKVNGDRPLFQDVSFVLPQAGSVLIEAGSGKGKSSLLFGIKGIFQHDKVYTGRLFFQKKPLDGSIRKTMGLVLQNPHSQMISTLVKDELVFGRVTGHDTSRNRVRETTDILGLESLLERPVRHLSSGQKHMVAIGAAGLMNPRILLLDEPFLYLDPENIKRTLRYITYLQNLGTGIIVTSHPGIVDHSRFNACISMTASTLGAVVREFPVTNAHPDLRDHRRIGMDRIAFGHDLNHLLSRDLSAEITGGEELWITGPNGSGKTTLLGILSGARDPEEGTITRQGTSAQCKIAMITQNPDRQFFEATVLDEMLAGALGKDRANDLTELRLAFIMDLLDTVGLAKKQSISPFCLSFGEKIFLATAQALVLCPDFIFVDDILGFMDRGERETLLDLLRNAASKMGCGLVFTSSRGMFAPRGTPSIQLPHIHSAAGLSGDDQCHDAMTADTGETSQTRGRSAGKHSSLKKPGLLKRMGRLLKSPCYDYVPVQSWLHRANPLVKLGISMMTWLALFLVPEPGHPAVAGVLTLYYLSGGMGLGRFVADSRFFALQSVLFALFMPLFRWDPGAWIEGAAAGVRVWMFFIPVMVMMRTTTVSEWMAVFGRFLSEQKRLAMGISFGLLPAIVADAKEILHTQRLKGLVPETRDLLHPKRLFYGLKAVFIPLLIMIEDLAYLAGLSVKLRGYDD